jgi:hypothetical protein
MVVWYSLWSFGIFFPLWHVSATKNLATLLQSREKALNLAIRKMKQDSACRLCLF